MSRPMSTIPVLSPSVLSAVVAAAAVIAAAAACRSAPTLPPAPPSSPTAAAAAPTPPVIAAAPDTPSAVPTPVVAPPLQVTVTALAALLRSTPVPLAPRTGGAMAPAPVVMFGGGGSATVNGLFPDLAPARYGNGGAPAAPRNGLS